MSFRPCSAAELVAAYREGRATPRTVVERALAAAADNDRRQPPMRTFIALDAADARAQADQATLRYQQGRALGPLDGVPLAIKDEFDVRGYPTTLGTSFLGGAPATRDVESVARLRAAGAILFGKANMHELGVLPSGFNLHHGTARNPFDPARDTGGSSSGSGAAVGAGLVPIALGNDSGGSVRIPAAICGVAGLKPTFGRVPTAGVALLNWSMECSGPLGATVGDVATALAVLDGQPLALPTVEPKRLRLGVSEAWWKLARDEAAAPARAAVERLGATVVPVELPHIELAHAIGVATFSVEAAASTEAYWRADRPLAPSTRVVLESGRGIAAVGFVKAQRVRALLAADFERALAAVDVLVTPTTAAAAPRYRDDTLAGGELNEESAREMTCFTMPLNLTGLPGMSVPCGYTDGDGMPVGLQIIARHGADALALAVAALVEKSTERRRPAVWHDLLT
jgi:Asp-tRNA(Asn)/Glu-tRNA(Gln) amidotransferase A subunit family amidase